MEHVVRFEPIRFNLAPAGELLLPGVRERFPRRHRVRRGFEILLMAGSKSDYLEDKFKNLILGAVAFTAPGSVYFGLWGTAGSLTDASNGATANEITGGAYDRVTMTNNTTNFATVTGTAKVNSVAITFPTATANWNASANINQCGVFDGNLKTSADNLLLWGDLTVPKPVLNGDIAQFAASAFSYTED